MKKAYLLFGFLVGLVGASVLFALLRPSHSVQGSETRRLKIGHNLPTSHPVHAGIVHFAERVAFHSGGKLQFQIYPNSQLGDDTQMLERLQSGTLDATKAGSATLGNFTPVTRIFSLPYLFSSDEHYWKTLDGDIGKSILEQLSYTPDGEANGLHGLSYFDAGSRNLYAKKPIKSLADLKGMKIRVMNDPIAMDTITALGASPSPISWGELYTALQQGVVDGAENNPPSYVASRHFEVCKEFSFDHHSRNPDIIVFAQSTWDTLTDEEKGWIEESAAEASLFQRNAWADSVQDALATMKEEGVNVYELDMEPFVTATQPVREKYAVGKLKALLEEIQNISE